MTPRNPPEGPPVSLVREVLTDALGLLGHSSRRPFLVYAQGRTGSTLLGSLLASHPQVFFGDEELRGPVRLPLHYLEGRRARHRRVCYGCHVKPYHLTDSQGIQDARPWLERLHRKGWLIVHLERRNTLRQVVSNFSRSANGTPHFYRGDGRRAARVTVDPQQLLDLIAQRMAIAEREREDLADIPHEHVVYEEDLLDPEAWQATTDRLFAALDLRPCAPASALRRINQGPLSQIVANYDHVAAAVAASPWAALLE